MKNNPILRRGHKTDKPLMLWQQLTDSLYGAGPPQKDVNAWKKTWTEWKTDVKRKLTQNNASPKQLVENPSRISTEPTEVIVRVCGMLKSVVGVADNAPRSSQRN
ncbi:unnamed protein product [Ceratitis capitata]|uniref:Regulatory protein zeste n=1 Tax=Ceratitis capitata TaxID=7213 RepID=A0A811UE52_CERCA|nr:unnamed protein product [Ceratitis capitata]